MITREPIYAALFALTESIEGLVTRSRKLRHWADVSTLTEQPALFQAQGSPIAEVVTGQPTRWTLPVNWYLYVSTAGEMSPGEVMNPILDSIEAAFAPNRLGVPQTLGGLVQYARIEGTIDTSEGTLGDQEVAIIPIKMLAAA